MDLLDLFSGMINLESVSLGEKAAALMQVRDLCSVSDGKPGEMVTGLSYLAMDVYNNAVATMKNEFPHMSIEEIMKHIGDSADESLKIMREGN